MADAGVTVMDCRSTAFTASVVDAEKPWYAAAIVVAPLFTPLAKPTEEMLAVNGLDEVHCAEVVRSMTLPSL